MISKTLLHYQVLGELGRGGMGVVYRALDTKLGRPVALKVLPEQVVAADPARRERFFREAKAASALNHPNIVTIYDVNTAGGVDIIVMELVEGRTLLAEIQQGPLPIERVCDYGVQIAGALNKAHAAGIVHRDLKPANVMINADGQVKILDFGLAKLTEQVGEDDGGEETKTLAAPLTAAGQVFGTLAYMSPEQLQGEQVDSRTDIFSFGVMLHEMLAGSLPFHQTTVPALIHKIVFEPPLSLRTKRPDVPPPLEAITLKAMAKAREDRFASMGEIATELRAVAIGTSTFRIAAPKWKLSRRALAMSASVVLAAAVGIAAIYYKSKKETEPGSVISLPANTADLQKLARGWLDKSYVKGNVDRALQALEKLLRAEPGNAVASAMLAETYWRKNNESADPHFVEMIRENAARATNLNPELVAAEVYYGVYLLTAGKHEEAASKLKAAAARDPMSPLPHLFLGQVAMARKKPDEAERAFRRATELGGNAWSTHANLGAYLYRQGRHEEALKTFERTRELAPDNPTVHTNIAAVYHHMERQEEAASALQRALEIRPTSGVFNNLATIYFYQGKYGEAVKVFEKALNAGAHSYLHWGNYGDACRWSLPDKSKAFDAYRRALELARTERAKRPEDLEIRSRIASYLAKSGKVEEAALEVEALEAKQPETGSVLFKLAQVREIRGDRAKALEHLRAALAAGYSRKEIERDPELVALRRDPGYHRLLLAATK